LRIDVSGLQFYLTFADFLNLLVVLHGGLQMLSKHGFGQTENLRIYGTGGGQ
jgi:hypothetical protein